MKTHCNLSNGQKLNLQKSNKIRNKSNTKKIQTSDSVVVSMLFYSSFRAEKREAFPDSFEYWVDWLGVNLHQINIFGIADLWQ